MLVIHLVNAAILALYALPPLLAAVSDLRERRVPNALPLAACAGFLVAAWLTPLPVAWGSHLGAGALILALGAAAFARGWMGGGDVKLLASCALWCGFSALPALLLAVGASGGALALGLLLTRRRRAAGPDAPTGVALPYAVAIALGALFAAARLPLLTAV